MSLDTCVATSLFAAGFSTFWHAELEAQKKRIAETPENGDNDEGDVRALEALVGQKEVAQGTATATEEKSLSRGEELRLKYGHLSPEARKALLRKKIEENKKHNEIINNGSQPYSRKYHVVPDMLEKDIRDKVCKNGVYINNPTAKPLLSMIKGNYIENKQKNGMFPYVITMSGEIVIGNRNGNGSEGIRTPHPTIIGGKESIVRMAGMLDIRGGKIYDFDNQSGHYKPNSRSMKFAEEVFKSLPKVLFSKKSPHRRWFQ